MHDQFRYGVAWLLLRGIGVGVLFIGLAFGLDHACGDQVKKLDDQNKGKGQYALLLCVEPTKPPVGELIVMEVSNAEGWSDYLKFRSVGKNGRVYCALDDHFERRAYGVETVRLRPDIMDHGITRIDVWPAKPGMTVKDNFTRGIRMYIPIRAAFNEFVYAAVVDPDPWTHRVYIGAPIQHATARTGF